MKKKHVPSLLVFLHALNNLPKSQLNLKIQAVEKKLLY